jgi:two-component system, cell cycle sensor histidine kinase and response regulator CckA
VTFDQSKLPRGDGQLLLLVEDEVPLRKMLESILEIYGYKVLPASDGVEALAIYAQKGGSIKLVITDMAMPRMNGVTLIKELRHLDPGVKIIGVSGLASNRTALDACGVPYFLLKPCSSEQLLAIVDKAIKV